MHQNQKQIALVAYRRWEERGCPLGTPDADWHRAEKELAETKLSKMAWKAGLIAGKVATIIKPK